MPVRFLNMNEKTEERYGSFIIDQVTKKHFPRIRESVDFMLKMQKEFDSTLVDVTLYLDEFPEGGMYQGFAVNIGFIRDRISFQLDFNGKDVGFLVFDEFVCWNENDEEAASVKLREDIDKQKMENTPNSLPPNFINDVISGKIHQDDPRWKSMESYGMDLIKHQIPIRITEKGSIRSKSLFYKFMSNDKIDQQEAAELYVLYPLHLVHEGQGLHFILTLHQFNPLKDKYNLNDDALEKFEESMRKKGLIEDNPGYFSEEQEL